MNSRAVFAAALFCLASCASRGAKTAPRAYLDNASPFVLLPPDGVEKHMDMAQRISASWGDKEYFFLAWVKSDDQGLDISFFSDLGAGMGELSYRSGSVTFSPSGSFAPEYIVADFQLCFYDAALLSTALSRCALSLETRAESGGAETRRIMNGKKIIVEIKKTPSSVKLVNHIRGYAYTLEGDFR
ncbi:MAG: DUF3261 domain-containing protein [Treponema sp.]|nr:DUF3261 domain-containing protein [Treponema sp.]